MRILGRLAICSMLPPNQHLSLHTFHPRDPMFLILWYSPHSFHFWWDLLVFPFLPPSEKIYHCMDPAAHPPHGLFLWLIQFPSGLDLGHSESKLRSHSSSGHQIASAMTEKGHRPWNFDKLVDLLGAFRLVLSDVLRWMQGPKAFSRESWERSNFVRSSHRSSLEICGGNLEVGVLANSRSAMIDSVGFTSQSRLIET